jgi:hypothetical protein
MPILGPDTPPPNPPLETGKLRQDYRPPSREPLDPVVLIRETVRTLSEEERYALARSLQPFLARAMSRPVIAASLKKWADSVRI